VADRLRWCGISPGVSSGSGHSSVEAGVAEAVSGIICSCVAVEPADSGEADISLEGGNVK
jgi:hypothetical protein